MKIRPSDYTIFVRPFVGLGAIECKAVQDGIEDFMASTAGQQRGQYEYHIFQWEGPGEKLWIPLKKATKGIAYIGFIRHDNLRLIVFPDSLADEIGAPRQTDLEALSLLVQGAIESQK